MNNQEQRLCQMLLSVAKALPIDFRPDFVFVGGATTFLFITESSVRNRLRQTDDVDLAVHTPGHAHWYRLLEQLRDCGFTESPLDDVICRFRLDDLVVDVMPDNEEILGFSNPWYAEAMQRVDSYELA